MNLYPTFNSSNEEMKWYRGNLHCHSTASDGTMSPCDIASWYKNAGYDFVGITDHGMLTKTPSQDSFLIIPSVELNTNTDRKIDDHLNGVFHVVGIGIKNDFINPETKHPQELIDTIIKTGGLAIIAHPSWSANIIDEEFLSLRNYIGIECYNSYCDIGKHKGIGSFHWDMLLSLGRYTLGFAADDAHGKIPNDKGHGWIMVHAKNLTEEDILSSIRCGHYYSSNGPEIQSYTIENDIVKVQCSPAFAIHFIGKGSNGLSIRAEDDNNLLTNASYPLKGSEKFMRIEIEDKNHKTAWTNPLFL